MFPFFLPHGVYSLGTAIVLQQSPTPGDNFLSHRRYDTIRDAILTCARKPTRVSLIYRTETDN